MKKRKIILIILVILFIISLILWSAPLFAQKDFLEMPAEKLELKEPKILPTQPFYFFKNLSWKIKEKLSFNPEKRIFTKMKFNSLILLELKKLIKKSPENSALFEKILENYKKNQANLKNEFANYLTQQSVTDQFLEKIIKQCIGQLKILEDILDQNLSLSSDIKTKIEEIKQDQEKWLQELINQLKNQEKFELILKNILEQEDFDWQNFRSLMILEKIKEFLSENFKNSWEEKKEDFLIDFLTYLYETPQEEINQNLSNLPGDKILQWKIFRDLEEKTGQREFFQNLKKNLEIIIDQKEKAKNCQAEIEKLKIKIEELKKDSEKLEKRSSNIKSLLEQAEAHLKQAELTNPNHIANLCGLVQSAKILIENAERYLKHFSEKNLEERIIETQKELENLKNLTNQYDHLQWARLFTLLEEASKKLELAKLNFQNNQISFSEKLLLKVELIINQIKKILLFSKEENSQKFKNWKKDFFTQEKIEEFQRWCLNQEGNFIEIKRILPSCVLKEKEVRMEDWQP